MYFLIFTYTHTPYDCIDLNVVILLDCENAGMLLFWVNTERVLFGKSEIT